MTDSPRQVPSASSLSAAPAADDVDPEKARLLFLIGGVHPPPWAVAWFARTAGAFSEDRERCVVAGRTDFLVNPVNLSALGAMLHSLSEGR